MGFSNRQYKYLLNLINAITGSNGDMTKAVYDPTTKNASAFSMTNMDEGTTNKIFTSTERTKLTAITGTNTGNDATNTQYSGLAASKQDAMGINDNYVTDAEKTVIGNTSGANSGDGAAHNQDASTINAGTLDGDRLPVISATKKGGVPLTGTPSGKFLKDDNTWSAPTASVAITEVEIDCGATPVIEVIINVTNAGISTGSKIIGGVAYKAPTGKDLDELECDAIELKFEPLAGSFNVHIKGLEGSLHDKFIVWYLYA